MCSTWASVSAVMALAVAGTSNSSLITLTVLLLASTLFALAPLEMLILADPFLKRLNVSFENFFDGILSFFLEILVVVAFLASFLVALTERSAGGLVSEALAVEL